MEIRSKERATRGAGDSKIPKPKKTETPKNNDGEGPSTPKETPTQPKPKVEEPTTQPKPKVEEPTTQPKPKQHADEGVGDTAKNKGKGSADGETPTQPKPKVEEPRTQPKPKVEEPGLNKTGETEPTLLSHAESGRNIPGKALISGQLTNPPVLMRGTHNSAGKVPLEVAEKMKNLEFKNFDEFRSKFWKTMAESSYAKEFKPIDIQRMKSGTAPRADDSQWLGQRKSYELHHMTPINNGGAVYDLSNILIVTPRYHIETLSKSTHFGGK